MKRQFGLVGYPLSHTFSPSYFAQKFSTENIIDAEYKAFEEADLLSFLSQVKTEQTILGFNVTIPYKQAILPYLDSISNEASYVGAVNTVKLVNGKLFGYNTDVFGFQNSLKSLLKQHHNKALIFGTGGGAKAVQFVCKQLSIQTVTVSRFSQRGQITYEQLNDNFITNHKLLINTTPVGMYPKNDEAISIPYAAITNEHLCYDLIYNPPETLFLKRAKQQGATIKNGLEMLHLQAEQSWKIWNED